EFALGALERRDVEVACGLDAVHVDIVEPDAGVDRDVAGAAGVADVHVVEGDLVIAVAGVDVDAEVGGDVADVDDVEVVVGVVVNRGGEGGVNNERTDRHAVDIHQVTAAGGIDEDVADILKIHVRLVRGECAVDPRLCAEGVGEAGDANGGGVDLRN